MSNTASTVTIIVAVAAIVAAQGAWMRHALDGVHRRIDDLRNEMRRGFDAIEARLARIEAKLDDHETRISRLEGAQP